MYSVGIAEVQADNVTLLSVIATCTIDSAIAVNCGHLQLNSS